MDDGVWEAGGVRSCEFRGGGQADDEGEVAARIGRVSEDFDRARIGDDAEAWPTMVARDDRPGRVGEEGGEGVVKSMIFADESRDGRGVTPGGVAKSISHVANSSSDSSSATVSPRLAMTLNGVVGLMGLVGRLRCL